MLGIIVSLLEVTVNTFGGGLGLIMNSFIVPIFLYLLLVIFFVWKIYEFLYYKSNGFKKLKQDYSSYVVDCNALNEHIEELKLTYANIKKMDYGSANLRDESAYKYNRPHQVNAKQSEFIHECSATVCKNAEAQPFKYLCKYFNIKTNETALESFENILNNFSAVEEGKVLLEQKLDKMQHSVKNKVPALIKAFSMKTVMSKLGFQKIDFSTLYFPVYWFRYISHGGNKSTRCGIVLDIQNLNRFVVYLSEIIKFQKSSAGQRALMTSKLREQIKQRDNYTCKICKISTRDEAHLLLEIDHIIPISKGGGSTEKNLQTLCWKCNRSKGAKISF